MPISGKLACELSSAGMGIGFGAIASGPSGGTLTAPAMLAGGAFGYVLGRAVCRIRALQDAFDRLFNKDQWDALLNVSQNKSVASEFVAIAKSDAGLSDQKAKAIWAVFQQAVASRNRQAFDKKKIVAAKFHNPTGAAKNGLSVLSAPMRTNA